MQPDQEDPFSSHNANINWINDLINYEDDNKPRRRNASIGHSSLNIMLIKGRGKLHPDLGQESWKAGIESGLAAP